jgi:hypothetical protein
MRGHLTKRKFMYAKNSRESAVLVGVLFGSHPMLFEQIFYPIV